LIAEIRKELLKHSEPSYKEGSKRFFKEEINPHGVRIPNVRKIGDEFFRKHDLGYEGYVKLGESLLKTGFFEEGCLAFHFLSKFKKNFGKEEFSLLSKWLDRYVDNWAWCDWLSTDLVAGCLKKDDSLVKNLYSWTQSKNRWVVRSAAVSLVPLARKGMFLKESLDIAKRNLPYKDDLIQKGTGWMLRELAKTKKKEVFDFLMKNKKGMGRTLMRYAIEHFSASERKRVMS